MLFTSSYCYDTLTDIQEAGLIFILKSLSPASEEAAFRRRWLVSASLEWRFVDFGVATIDL